MTTKKNTKVLKNDDIHVRCTAQQKAAIEKGAEREGVGASTWLLQLALRALRETDEARS